MVLDVCLNVFVGLVPVASHRAIYFAVEKIEEQIKEIEDGRDADGSIKRGLLKNKPLTIKMVGVSLVRDVLAIATIATLAALSILTPVVAISVSAVLLISSAFSAKKLGFLLSMDEKFLQSLTDPSSTS